jgi:hypothetical protein
MAALQQNNLAINRAAFRWLKEVKAPAPDHYLHLLNLAHWGMAMENAVKGEWPWLERAALKEQLDSLFGWKAANALAWLLTNPNGPTKDEQMASLHTLLQTAQDARAASGHVLNAIYSRQQSQNTALQPAASELS